MRFNYEGFDAKANVKRGFIDAENQQQAAEKLRELGIFTNVLEPDSQDPKTVLAGGETMNVKAEPEKEEKPEPKPKAESKPESEPEPDSNPETVSPDAWKRNLAARFAAINKVIDHLRDSPLLLEAGSLTPWVEQARSDAIQEAIKQAILKAIVEAQGFNR